MNVVSFFAAAVDEVSSTCRSPTAVGVERTNAIFCAAASAVYDITSSLPDVTRIDLAARDVDALDVGVALLAGADEDAAAVAAPDRSARKLTARRALVAADAAVDVEVVGGRQVARRAGAKLGDPEVGLSVGALRVARQRADECDAPAVGRERVGADRVRRCS